MSPAPLSPVLGEPPRRRTVSITTPEGLSLPFEVAGAGERLAAHLCDLACLALLVLGLVLMLSMADAASWLAALGVLAVFLLVNGWFLGFELRPGAATPGKRWFRLRVMDARGGVLTADAVVARNLMRNLELNVPLAVALGGGGNLWPGASGWLRLAAVAWIFLVAGLPLFSRLRLRAGDLVGGTLVVVVPRPVLLADLTRAVRAPAVATAAAAEAETTFTEEQLSVYGVYELQVLEDVLRRADAGGLEARDEDRVAQKIARKIRWTGTLEPRQAGRFLRAYYAALRRHQEQRLLLGKRKQDKRSREQ